MNDALLRRFALLSSNAGSWGKRHLARVSTGGALFGAAALVMGAALIPHMKANADAVSAVVPRPPLIGPAMSVTSGDSFIMEHQRVMLWGIAAPSTVTPDGQKAAAYLTALVDDHQLTCVLTGQKSYDRAIVRCADPWNRDVAEMMVASGWVAVMADYSGGHYATAEADAKSHGRGLFNESAVRPDMTVMAAVLDGMGPPVPASPGTPSGHVVPRIDPGAR